MATGARAQSQRVHKQMIADHARSVHPQDLKVVCFKPLYSDLCLQLDQENEKG